MNPLQVFRVAVLALYRNKMRSFLTILGVIIGVSAVIAMVAIGEGAKARVQETFSSMGSNMVIVMSGSTNQGGARGGFGSSSTLTWGDLEAIQTELSAVRYATVSMQRQTQIQSQGQNWSTRVMGTGPEFFSIRNWAVDRGEPITQSDLDSSAQVVVLGQTVVDNIFGSDFDPVGQSVRIANVPFQVVGVLESKGQSSRGEDTDDTAIVPHTTFRSRLSSGLGQFIQGSIMVSARSADETERAQEQLTELLRDRHRIREGADDDFHVRNLTEMAEAMEESTSTFTTLLAAIAAVSLLVGGIGIMNIMLVSVTERTREIGLRMAIGARSRDIMAQFLVESLTLSATGGFIGVILGVVAAQQLAARYGWSMLVRPDIVVVAVVFSAAIGVGFGLYPARKASQLDPIDALRYE